MNQQKEQKTASVTMWPQEKMKIVELKKAFSPYNPRVVLKPGMEEYENLKMSIKEHGFADYGIVYNKRTSHLVGGHQRVTVLGDLGMKEVLVTVVDIPED